MVVVDCLLDLKGMLTHVNGIFVHFSHICVLNEIIRLETQLNAMLFCSSSFKCKPFERQT